MPTLPEMNADVFFGDAERGLPDWREILPEDEEDGNDREPSEGVVAILGFDPREIAAGDEEETVELSTDAQGHEHAGKGPHGGEFISLESTGESGAAKEGFVSESSDPDLSKPFATEEQLHARAKDVRPRQIVPVNTVGHTPISRKHLDALATSIEENGWQGSPLLAMKREDVWQGLTGSHRLAAADKTGLDSVPVVFVDHDDVLQWAKKAGYDLPDDADLTDLEDEDRLKIIFAGDNKVAKEIMRREVYGGGVYGSDS